MIPGLEALERLKTGNQKFVQSLRSGGAGAEVRPFELGKDQQPFAIILGCSDSRVPAELVFGQGFGDLFVIRVAGNIVAPSQVGSIEFAAARFDTRLAVVLGHTSCGAILATLDELKQDEKHKSPNLRAIVDRIRPAVEPLLADKAARHDDIVRRAVRANIQASVDHLRHGSAILEQLVAKNGLLIVGAEYCLETGVVEFL